MFTFIFYIVGLTTLVSFFYYKKLNKSISKYFLYFFSWTFVVELIYNIVRIRYFQTNEIIFNYYITYNIHTIISFVFFFYFYHKLSKNKRNKKIFLVFIYAFGFFALLNYFVLNNNITDDNLNVNNIIVGSVFLLITIILFLIEIINNEKIVFNIYKSFIFWISIGLLLFYIGILPIMISTEYLNYNITYMSILNSINVIMYGSFIIGMVKSETKYNY